MDESHDIKEQVPDCTEVKLVYDLSLIPVFGLFFYILLFLVIGYKLGFDIMNKSSYFRKASKRAFANFIVCAIICFCLLVIYLPSFGHEYKNRRGITLDNLVSLRASIQMYRDLTGTFPSNDLAELVSVKFKINGMQRRILEGEIKPEFISSVRQEKNSSNRKVHNTLNSEGGWYYDPITGNVRVNYDRMLGKEWYPLGGVVSNPSQW